MLLGYVDMNRTPKISVLTPVYNCARYLNRCIESVQNQAYPNVEHVVVDGGSQDGTVEILKSYPHLVWISEPDTGEANALNKALRMATGDFIVWLNGDDWLEPGAFLAIAERVRLQPDIDVLYGKARIIYEKTGEIYIKAPLHQISMPELVRWWICNQHPHQPSMYYSRRAVESTGEFNEKLHFSIDYDYWLRLATKFSFGYVDSILANALIRQDCKSAGTEPEQIKSHWNVIRPYVEGLPFPDQQQFWGNYYLHRFVELCPAEESRLPEDNAACDGLIALLTTQPGPPMVDRFARLFTSQQQQDLVTRRLEEYARVTRQRSERP
ncbi:MAG: glycosyltransferase [Proteobacteria bacterium]|nr:glycosyltransferase [Pseudomonadota bacterium]